MGHRALLVTLKFLLIGQVGEIGIVYSAFALLIIFHQGGCCEVIVVGMTVPVDVEGYVVGLVQFPFPTGRDGGISVFHVVGLHVVMRIFAAWTVDAFPINTAIGIQFQILGRCVGQVLRHLPVGVAVDSLVA